MCLYSGGRLVRRQTCPIAEPTLTTSSGNATKQGARPRKRCLRVRVSNLSWLGVGIWQLDRILLPTLTYTWGETKFTPQIKGPLAPRSSVVARCINRLKMRSNSRLLAGASIFSALATALELNISANTAGSVESDWTTTYYSHDTPLLIANDGGASTGGFHVYDVDAGTPLESTLDQFTGRTKLVQTIYGIGGKDYMVSIPQTTSTFSFYDLPGVERIDDVAFKALGDWSALCSWKSRSGNTYLFLFGKRQAVQFLARERDGAVEMVEVSFCVAGST